MRISIPISLNFLLSCVFARVQIVATFILPSKTSAGFNHSRPSSVPIPLSSTVERKQIDFSATQIFSSNDSNELPPHTALAQVLANQLNIDLSTVEPSNTKITAADVEFHAYKISQPPCTPQALELAYSYNLDLNLLYDRYRYADNQEEGNVPKFLTISDVELLHDNLRSFRATIHTTRGNRAEKLPADRRRKKHLKKLEDRIEKNAGQLSEKALQAVDSVATIVQTVQSQVKLPIPGGIFGSDNNKIDSVQDFDQDLANEIQAALMSAGIDDDETANILSMLDVPLNGNTDDMTKTIDVDRSIQKGAVGMDSNPDNKSASFFFADPR